MYDLTDMVSQVKLRSIDKLKWERTAVVPRTSERRCAKHAVWIFTSFSCKLLWLRQCLEKTRKKKFFLTISEVGLYSGRVTKMTTQGSLQKFLQTGGSGVYYYTQYNINSRYSCPMFTSCCVQSCWKGTREIKNNISNTADRKKYLTL